ncbi:alpha/beta hydrolase YcfP [Pasteurellaceae bacterium LIM206]|nr:alpha/beta hydrolase YcfP [Pasteurellaceae bacterium LIM206]
MIIYLHGFSSSRPDDYENILQLKMIDTDVRCINYSTRHPLHDMSYILAETHKLVSENKDLVPMICGCGLGGYWAERVGFLCGIKQVILNPNLHPAVNMEGRIDRPEEYLSIEGKCVSEFRVKNKGRCLVFLSLNNKIVDPRQSEQELSPYYQVIWDNTSAHQFKHITPYIRQLREFKNS